MQRLLLLLWLAPCFVVKAQITSGQEMLRLSTKEPLHQITLNTTVATTLTFPAPVTLVTGYGMVLDAGSAQQLIESERLTATTLGGTQPPVPVTIVHYAQASADTLVLRAVRQGAPCFVTVRTGSSIHLFQLNAGLEANLAVILDDGAASAPQTRPVQKKEVLATRHKYSASELMGILAKARQRIFVETVNPGLYAGWQERNHLALVSQHGAVSSMITDIQRWPEKDALIFRCRVKNNSTTRLYFNPTDVKLRVADRAYSVQLADSSGTLEAGAETALDLVCQGDGTGSQEHLSISNDFRLDLFASVESPQTGPLSIPNPLLPTLESPSDGVLQSTDNVPLPNFYPAASK